MNKTSITDAMRLCMHRPPALRSPIPAPAKPLARVLMPEQGQDNGQAAGGLKPYDHQTEPELPNPEFKRDQAPALGATAAGEEKGVAGTEGRHRVRITGYRVRPLDPDNFAASVKDCLDGLRHGHLIPGDEPWKIILETEQVKVGSFKEERTEISISYP